MSIYTGIDEKGKKVSNIYIGIDEKAKKVIKVYYGINGHARMIYPHRETKMAVPNTGFVNVNDVYYQSTTTTSNYVASRYSLYPIYSNRGDYTALKSIYTPANKLYFTPGRTSLYFSDWDREKTNSINVSRLDIGLLNNLYHFLYNRKLFGKMSDLNFNREISDLTSAFSNSIVRVTEEDNIKIKVNGETNHAFYWFGHNNLNLNFIALPYFNHCDTFRRSTIHKLNFEINGNNTVGLFLDSKINYLNGNIKTEYFSLGLSNSNSKEIFININIVNDNYVAKNAFNRINSAGIINISTSNMGEIVEPKENIILGYIGETTKLNYIGPLYFTFPNYEIANIFKYHTVSCTTSFGSIITGYEDIQWDEISATTLPIEWANDTYKYNGWYNSKLDRYILYPQ